MTDPPGIPPRELEVLWAMLQPGGSRRQAARQLGISEHTVNSHLRSLYRRLGVNSAGQAMARLADQWRVPATSEPAPVDPTLHE